MKKPSAKSGGATTVRPRAGTPGSLNKVMLLGRLGRDAEKSITPTGREFITFTLATTRRWRSKNGDLHETKDWHYVRHLGRSQPGSLDGLLAYLIRDKLVHVEDELRTRSWTKNGRTRYRTEVHAERIQLASGTMPR